MYTLTFATHLNKTNTRPQKQDKVWKIPGKIQNMEDMDAAILNIELWEYFYSENSFKFFLNELCIKSGYIHNKFKNSHNTVYLL